MQGLFGPYPAKGGLLTAAACLIAIACASAPPQPGEPGYPYNVSGTYQAEFVVEGTAYPGTVEMTTATAGIVDGSMRVTSPVTVTGPVSGTVLGDQLAFTIDYLMEENGCTGTVDGNGTIAEGGGGTSGTITVWSECDEETLDGTFSFTRAPAGQGN